FVGGQVGKGKIDLPAGHSILQDAAQPLNMHHVAEEKSAVAPTLEGNLGEMQAPSLLQSIAISKMSGRLSVVSTAGGPEIFFENGIPIHGTALTATGDASIVELTTWEAGKFRFQRGETTTERTVKRRLDTLLLEGATLLDQLRHLQKCGLRMEAYLVKKE